MTRQELYTLIGLCKNHYESFKYYKVSNGYRIVYYGIKNHEDSLDAIKAKLEPYEHSLEFIDGKMVVTVFTSIPYGLKVLKDDYHAKISEIAYFLWLENPEGTCFDHWIEAERKYHSSHPPKYG